MDIAYDGAAFDARRGSQKRTKATQNGRRFTFGDCKRKGVLHLQAPWDRTARGSSATQFVCVGILGDAIRLKRSYNNIYDTPGGRKRSEQTAAFSLAGLKQVSRRLELTGRKAGRLGKESCQKSVKSTSALDPQGGGIAQGGPLKLRPERRS